MCQCSIKSLCFSSFPRLRCRNLKTSLRNNCRYWEFNWTLVLFAQVNIEHHLSLRTGLFPVCHSLCPRQELNLDPELRSLLFYPLNYRGLGRGGQLPIVRHKRIRLWWKLWE